MVANEILEQIRDALDIADIIGERVKLRPSSRGYMGLCPFHEENTPSFHVYTDTQTYYCFGCHEAGNIFSFLMKADNLTFPEAVKTLADRAGIELPKYETPGERTAYEVLELAAKFYAGSLSSAPLAYLERRKLDRADITRFSLGYAPSAWDSLVRHLHSQKVTDKQMLDLGLAVEGRHGLYDKFRGRVIFPIRDVAGKVIAFGGRLIDGEGAKYLNSPESAIYHKRKHLYLLDKARTAIRERKRSILVEGYMDAIRLHKCGFTESVASLGTSLTAEQAETLSRFADRCYICYDSDKAGQNAALKSMFVLQAHGLDVYVVSIPSGKDPDEFLAEHSPADFEAALTQARPLVVQYIEAFRPSLADTLTRKSAMKELFMTLAELEIHEVLPYKTQLSEATGVPPSKIEEWFTSRQKREVPEEAPAPLEAKGVEHPSEAAMCSLLCHHVECRLTLKPEDALKLIRNPAALNVALAFLSENVEEMMMIWTQIGDMDNLAVVARGDEVCARMKGLTMPEKFRSTYYTLRDRYTSRRVRELTAKLQKSQATPEELSELMRLKA
ncbi:MAG: DNA primase [Synergistaceae bacterium]|nr:DNA primase [Synergistaceae bacterium]